MDFAAPALPAETINMLYRLVPGFNEDGPVILNIAPYVRGEFSDDFDPYLARDSWIVTYGKIPVTVLFDEDGVYATIP